MLVTWKRCEFIVSSRRRPTSCGHDWTRPTSDTSDPTNYLPIALTICVCKECSKLCKQETGVPQGSILSVTLFCLKINSIIKAVCPRCRLLSLRGRLSDLLPFKTYSQRCLNKLQEWADTNGFKFSTAKTVCVHFCRLRKFHSFS